MSVREELERRLLEIPGLNPGPSRYGHGTSYFTGGREIAHFHGETRMDVRLTRDEIRQRKAEGTLDPRIRTRGPSAEWVEVQVVTTGDLAFALGLVEDAVRANS
jgi:luciferase-like monooxygenase